MPRPAARTAFIHRSAAARARATAGTTTGGTGTIGVRVRTGVTD